MKIDWGVGRSKDKPWQELPSLSRSMARPIAYPAIQTQAQVATSDQIAVSWGIILLQQGKARSSAISSEIPADPEMDIDRDPPCGRDRNHLAWHGLSQAATAAFPVQLLIQKKLQMRQIGSVAMLS